MLEDVGRVWHQKVCHRGTMCTKNASLAFGSAWPVDKKRWTFGWRKVHGLYGKVLHVSPSSVIYDDICVIQWYMYYIYICMYMAILCTLSILATAHHLVKRCTQLTLRKDHVSDCCLDNIPVWLPRVISTEEHPKGEEILTIPEMVACIFLLVWGKNCPLRRFKRSLNKCC